MTQHKFHRTRQWRFDFAFPEAYLAVEIQGYGTGHTSYKGMLSDYEKHNNAIREGWSIIYLMSSQLTPGSIKSTVNFVHAILKERLSHPELIIACRKLKPTEDPTRHEQLRKLFGDLTDDR